MLRFGVPFLT